MKKIVIDFSEDIENSDWLYISRLKRKAKQGDKEAENELKKLGIKMEEEND